MVRDIGKLGEINYGSKSERAMSIEVFASTEDDKFIENTMDTELNSV